MNPRPRFRHVLFTLLAAAFAAPAQGAFVLSNPSVYFGDKALKGTAAQSLFVGNDGADPFQLTGFSLAGPTGIDFSLVDSTTCTRDTMLRPGEHCRFDLAFAPTDGGTREATLRIYTDLSDLPFNVPVSGEGLKPVKPSDAFPDLVQAPVFAEFGARASGATTAPVRVTFTNYGSVNFSVDVIAVGGRNPNNFKVVDTNCVRPLLLKPNESCYADVVFAPLDTGPSGGVVRLRSLKGSLFGVTLYGYGGTLPAGSRVDVVEFYNAAFDHYFISSLTPDIVANDTGANAGWTRTGRAFSAFPPAGTPKAASDNASPVCRFYIPPQFGNSHFYSASPAECGEVRAKFPAFTFEAAAVFLAFLPDTATGECPAESIPVYRVWNQRADSNHRYVTDKALRDAMVAKGYVAEGYGPDGVALCSPI